MGNTKSSILGTGNLAGQVGARPPSAPMLSIGNLTTAMPELSSRSGRLSLPRRVPRKRPHVPSTSSSDGKKVCISQRQVSLRSASVRFSSGSSMSSIRKASGRQARYFIPVIDWSRPSAWMHTPLASTSLPVCQISPRISPKSDSLGRSLSKWKYGLTSISLAMASTRSQARGNDGPMMTRL